MRRGGPPMLPVEPGGVPAFARVERGPRGLRFAPVPAQDGASPDAPGAYRVVAAAPAGARRGSVVAEGRLALLCSPGVAFSVAIPRMVVVHDRRPPGLDRVIGAAGANAGLLHGGDGWRAVVLPSLGDVVAGLGDGPVAIRADGRRVAAASDGAVVEYDLGADGEAARHGGPADHLAYAGDGTLVAAAGAAVGAPGVAAADGSPVIDLAGALHAPRVAALHADGTVTVWEAGAGAPLASWASPVAAAGAVALTADGAQVALGVPDAPDPAACLAEAATGAPLRIVEGARIISPSADPADLLVAGDWGCAWLRPPEEDA